MEDGENGEEPESRLSSDWADLTNVCLINILSRLSLEDRWRRAMFVCKSWFHAARDPSLNSVFDLDPYFDPVNESPRWWTPEFGSKIDCMLRSVIQCSGESLVEIRVRNCSDRSLSLVSERCRNLQVLSIKSSPNVTDEPLNKIACVCPKLIELDISYCFEITHDSIASIGHKCPNFKILKRNLLNWPDPSQHLGIVPVAYLDAAPQDGDPEAFSIGNYMPNLTHLELRFSKFTAKGLSKISKGCPNLEIVDLSGCVNVTSRDIAKAWIEWKKLKDIKRPNIYIPRSAFHTERYGHWQLYDERFHTEKFLVVCLKLVVKLCFLNVVDT